MHRHLKQDLVPPDHINDSLSAGFSQIIEMMMVKDVAHRYRNASDLIDDIDAVLAGDQPNFAQPTLDFAMLSKVAKSTSSGAPVSPQIESMKVDGKGLMSLFLAFLIISVIANLILIAVLLV